MIDENDLLTFVVGQCRNGQFVLLGVVACHRTSNQISSSRLWLHIPSPLLRHQPAPFAEYKPAAAPSVRECASIRPPRESGAAALAVRHSSPWWRSALFFRVPPSPVHVVEAVAAASGML
jgi:hypothetical protein